ncbi:hypothetical protein AAFF_G00340540 [Aldrovandia affinis]|uniref:Uncharacterized protein n=1 Tax=Aldrovandia affinis TaxID=143900 RepID=A0AAD7SKG2_9TELE|nr:hypothetical protein AAFF_G00340540 [Aldrovandia affinis]
MAPWSSLPLSGLTQPRTLRSPGPDVFLAVSAASARRGAQRGAGALGQREPGTALINEPAHPAHSVISALKPFNGGERQKKKSAATVDSRSSVARPAAPATVVTYASAPPVGPPCPRRVGVEQGEEQRAAVKPPLDCVCVRNRNKKTSPSLAKRPPLAPRLLPIFLDVVKDVKCNRHYSAWSHMHGFPPYLDVATAAEEGLLAFPQTPPVDPHIKAVTDTFQVARKDYTGLRDLLPRSPAGGMLPEALSAAQPPTNQLQCLGSPPASRGPLPCDPQHRFHPKRT